MNVLPTPKFNDKLKANFGLLSTDKCYESVSNKCMRNDTNAINDLQINSLPWYSQSNRQLIDTNSHPKNGHSYNYSHTERQNKFSPKQSFRNHNDWQSKGQKRTTDDNRPQFGCDACCQSYASEQLLTAHLSEHIKCGIDGCKFEAHWRLIDSHQKSHFLFRDKSVMQTLMSLDTPEDIAKWREERKKKFPTKANIDIKKKENNELLLKSEHFSDNRQKHSFRRERSANSHRFTKRRHNFRQKNTFRKYETNEFNACFNDNFIESRDNHNVGEPIEKKSRVTVDSNDIEDGEIVDSDEETPKQSDASIVSIKANALGLLMAYNSEDDSDNESDRVDKSVNLLIEESNIVSPDVTEKQIKCDNLGTESKQSETSLEVDLNKNINSLVNSNEITEMTEIDTNIKKGQTVNSNKMKCFRNKAEHKPNTCRPRLRKLTLFEKLMINDVKRNEQQIMDCLKLIVNNNFLQNLK